jgi:thiol-disulfide isomerase/thioredoxin
MARLGLADLRAALDRQERADPPDRRAARELSWTNGQFDCAALIAEAELRRGRLSEAEHALADMRLDLDDADLERATSFWRLRSDLATRRGRTADAVAFAVRAWRLVPGLAPFQKRVDDAWAAAGLGPEGKAAWDESFADAPGTPSSARWKTVERPLPAFELTDYSGRQWTLADLAGHVVLLNAWATWCGPCKQELPWLERLHERIATRDDVIVLTLNVDENPTLVPAFVQQLGLTVPVLSAADLVTRIGDQGYPATWIVDASGVIRREALGFPPDGEAWMNEALRLLDEVAGRSQTPAGP